MKKFILLIVLSVISTNILANSSYQVDVILFAHPANLMQAYEPNHNSPMIPLNARGITVDFLKPSQSDLRDEYYLLNRRSQFQVLAQYSWVQRNSNQEAVILPQLNNKGWEMQGTMRIRQGTYYSLDADLQFAPYANPEASFAVVQKQRLKAGMVYYLDHPQIGMLVKIHKLT